MKLSKGILAVAFVGFILFVDQAVKIWIKTHLFLYENRCITNWFHIYFIENDGMAMGIGVDNKLFLSVFRILASFGVACYLYSLIRKNASLKRILCIAMIFAGAVSNIIDGVFYKKIFSESSPNNTAKFFIQKQTGKWLQGKVVDMFYFPLFEFSCPKKIPFVGGHRFIFFRYVFNLADAFICVGTFVLIFFHRKYISKSAEK